MKTMLNIKWVLLFSLLGVFSCEKEEEPEEELALGNGFFVVNEGGWGKGNSSLSFYNTDTKEVTNNVYEKANGVGLGELGQDVSVYGDTAFIVVQGGGRVDIINTTTAKLIKSVTDFVSPRFCLKANDSTAYISDWNDYVTGKVHVLNLDDYTVSTSIDVGSTPDEMLISGDKLYVANSGTNTVSIIDLATNMVSGSLNVGEGPNSLVEDANGSIWVSCKGKAAWDDNYTEVDTAGSDLAMLYKFANDVEQSKFTFELWGLRDLTISTDKKELVYIYKSKVYTMDVSAESLPSAEFVEGDYYGVEINTTDGGIITFDPGDWDGAGDIILWDENGQKSSTHAVGVGPGAIAFK